MNSEQGSKEVAIILEALKYKNSNHFFGELEVLSSPIIHYFSLVFPFKNSQSQTYFCKCPKADPSRQTLFPLEIADRTLGRNEFDSLKFLQKYWPSINGVTFVQPIFYQPTVNALVMEHCKGEEFYLWARGMDLRARVGGDRDKLANALRRVGRSHAHYHQSTESDAPPEGRQPANKIVEHQRVLLANHAHTGGVVDLALTRAQKYQPSRSCAQCLKGIDIRNMIILPDSSIKLFDPGRLKCEERESDIARLLTTIILLYWGSAWLVLPLFPQHCAIKSYLDGYQSVLPYDAERLRIYLLKELTKHWCMGYVALRLKRHPTMISSFLGHFYIDRFFRELLSAILTDDGYDKLRDRH